MPIYNVYRGAVPLGDALPGVAPLYIDSDDNILKVIPAGSGTTEVQLVDASSAQTLTTKTLTSPTITGATLTTATINGAVGTKAIEVVADTNVITAAESGTVFFLSHATEFVSTLPAPAAGLEYTFICANAPESADYTIVTAQAGSACEIIVGHVLTSGFADSGSDVETSAGGTTITFVQSVAVVGDRVHVISDGTLWYASCICAVEAGITISG